MLPLNLTLLGFISLLYTTFIFGFIIYSLLKNTKKNKVLDDLVDWLFTPLKELEKIFRFIVTFFISKEQLFKFIDKILNILDYTILKHNYYFLILWLIPRCCLLLLLVLDIFYFKAFYYKYIFIHIGILLLFNRCIRFSLKNLKEEISEELTLKGNKVVAPYCFGYNEYLDSNEDEEEEDPLMPGDMVHYNVSEFLPS